MQRIDCYQMISPPMPVTLLGCQVEGKPNFMTAAWVTRVSVKPQLIGVAVAHTHRTTPGLRETGTFSLCLPGPDLVEKTDYCGLVSGNTTDKSGLFDVFYGELITAPLIRECKLCLEVRLTQVVEIPTDDFYIGEIVAAWADPAILTDGKPDVDKYQPLLLTGPDNHYRTLGPVVADAWSVGKRRKQGEHA